jgi:glycosyltransferase involved in cell wall biosynthesis
LKIISIYPSYNSKGGAEDISIVLAKKLNDDIPVILTKTPSGLIHKDYRNERVKFECFNIANIIKYRNNRAIFLSHHRKLTTVLILFNLFLKQKIRLVHVAHNTFYNLRHFTLFPKNIIAVSNGVKENLIDYFKVSHERITVIFNGIEDAAGKSIFKEPYKAEQKIRILLIGRLCKEKQQVELVRATKGLLNENIEFYFAGDGPTLQDLKKETGTYNQYKILGHINIKNELHKYDYVCLFSKIEGLGNALIEGCMFGKPLITNDLQSVMDVNINGFNGFVVTDWNELILCINNLQFAGTEKYRKMSLNARKQYETHFTLEKMIMRYKEHFNDMDSENTNI